MIRNNILIAIIASVSLIPTTGDVVRGDPATDPEPAVEASYSVDLGPWESMIIIYFEPEDWQWAHDVILCETDPDWDENSYNSRSGAAGLFQFIPSTWAFSKPWPGASPYDPTAAFMAARWLLDNGGRSHWVCP